MDKKEAIERLKQALVEIPNLKKLRYNNQKFKLWFNKVDTIIKNVLDNDDYEKFDFVQAKYFPDELGIDRLLLEQNYLPKLSDYELALESIIQKYEMLGIEEKSAEKTAEKDTVKLPIQLFDKMQFHPKVIKASRALFVDGHYAQAIFEAFKAVNNFAKEKSGLSPNKRKGMGDKQLMATIFNERAPLIKLNELSTDTDISEQEGFKFLFMGATAGIRNPKAHDSVVQKDPYKTLEYLGFASLLVKKIDFWKIG